MADNAPASVVARLQGSIKDALKSGDKPRTEVLRLLLAAVKQRQIDGGEEVDDAGLIAVVEKMIKQRRDSIQHYEKAGRDDLKAQEEAEIALLQPFMPSMIGEEDLAAIVEEVILTSNAKGAKDMGGVMGILKTRLAGRADMSAVSKIVREKLASNG